MNSSLIVGGTIAIDRVVTPSSEASRLLGGSAAYAALAASFFCNDVRLVGIVGKDFPAEHLNMLADHGVNLTGVEQSEGNSFTWSGEYMENMNERVTLRVALNVLENWQVKVPDTISDARIVVLANMSPDNQMQMLSQCKNPDRFVIADTMDLWISITNERLHEVLQQVDLLVLNESEARDLSGTSHLIEAGRELLKKGPHFVAIKLGEFGSMLFSDAGDISPQTYFRCAAYPLEEIVDPTGAGDCFIGGIAGYLASLGEGRPTFENIRQACIRGAVLGSYACEAFSTQRMEEADMADVIQRLELFRQMTNW